MKSVAFYSDFHYHLFAFQATLEASYARLTDARISKLGSEAQASVDRGIDDASHAFSCGSQ